MSPGSMSFSHPSLSDTYNDHPSEPLHDHPSKPLQAPSYTPVYAAAYVKHCRFLINNSTQHSNHVHPNLALLARSSPQPRLALRQLITDSLTICL